MAFKYFQEFHENELRCKTSRLKRPNNKMLHSLVKTVTLTEDTQELHEISNQVVRSVLEYLAKWNLPLHFDILTALLDWFHLRKDVTVTESFVNQHKKCGHCSRSLELTVEKLFHETYLDYLRNFLVSKGLEREMLDMNNLFKGGNPYDILIDGGNILYYGIKSEKQFVPKRLENLLRNIISKNTRYKKVALVLPQSYHKPSKMNNLSFIKHIKREGVFDIELQVIAHKKVNDDVIFLYLAALSELIGQKNVMMLSNDHFFDHRFEITPVIQSSWLKWVNSRCSEIDNSGNIKEKSNIAPVVVDKGQNTHLIVNNELVYCIQKRK